MRRELKKKLRGGVFASVPPARSRNMRAIRGRGNHSTEQRLRLALVRFGVSGWRMRNKNLPGNPDFFFPAQLVVVFVDGCFWHGCPRCQRKPKTNKAFWVAKVEANRNRDSQVNRKLRSLGIRVLRFWEHQLRADVSTCISKVTAVVR